MKRMVLGILAVIAATGLLLAQGMWSDNLGGVYTGGRPPEISLPDAYALALAHIGRASNSFYCFTASCVDPKKNRAWLFTFASTNGQRGQVIVGFNRQAWPKLPDGGRMYLSQ